MAIPRLVDFAATCVFTKQSLEPILCGPRPLGSAQEPHVPGAPLLPKLRGHFAEFLLHGSLEHLRLLASPTCVGLRYGRTKHSPTGLFSAASLGDPWQDKSCTRRPVSPPTPSLKGARLHRCIGTTNTRRPLCFRVPPFGQTHFARHGNLDPFPIAYASRPRLRGRLTLGRLALPRKPQVYGEQVSHLLYRYSCPHMHFQDLQSSSRSTFTGNWNAPLPDTGSEDSVNPRLRWRA